MLKQWKIAGGSIVVGGVGCAGIGLSGNQTVTLSVPGMTCSACPITVKKALQKVQGVAKVTATFEPKEAVVTFDDRKTTIDRLREATTHAGYPSTVKE